MNKKTIAIIILAVIIIGSIGIYLKDSKAESKTTPEKINDATIAKFKEKMSSYNINYLDRFESKITNFEAMSNQDKLTMAFISLWDELDTNGTITEEKLLNDYFKKVFKDDTKYTNDTTMCYDKANSNARHCLITYDVGEKTYTLVKDNTIDTRDAEVAYTKVVDSKKVGDNYTITFVKLYTYSPKDELPTDYYKTYTSAKKYLISDKAFSLTGTEKEQIITSTDPFAQYNYLLQKMQDIDVSNYPKYEYSFEIVNDEILLTGYNFIK